MRPDGADTAPDQPSPEQRASLARRALVDVGTLLLVLAALYALWYVLEIVLLIFAGILLAITLHIPGDWLGNHTFLSRTAAVALTIVVILALLVGGGWLLVPRLSNQAQQVDEALDTIVNDVSVQLRESYWGRRLLRELPNLGQAAFARNLLGRVTGYFSGLGGTLANLLITLVVGLYLALQPDMYRRGLTQLVPPRHRQRARQVLGALTFSLKGWMLARLFAMLLIGVLTSLGLWIIGVRLPILLGILAALLTFIPVLGPLMATVPAVLIAMTQGTSLVIEVLLLYAGIQFVETYLLTPIVEQYAIDLPAALALLFQLVMGVAAGLLGVALAFPLLLVIILLVKMLYVEDVLGDTVKIPGARRKPYDLDV
jgi:predicted PurR-regulated permease PerM